MIEIEEYEQYKIKGFTLLHILEAAYGMGKNDQCMNQDEDLLVDSVGKVVSMLEEFESFTEINTNHFKKKDLMPSRAKKGLFVDSSGDLIIQQGATISEEDNLHAKIATGIHTQSHINDKNFRIKFMSSKQHSDEQFTGE